MSVGELPRAISRTFGKTLFLSQNVHLKSNTWNCAPPEYSRLNKVGISQSALDDQGFIVLAPPDFCTFRQPCLILSTFLHLVTPLAWVFNSSIKQGVVGFCINIQNIWLCFYFCIPLPFHGIFLFSPDLLATKSCILILEIVVLILF